MTTTTTLDMPEPDDPNRELRELLRWAGATLADPTTDPALCSDLEVALGTFDVFAPQHRDVVDPGLRAALLDIYRNPPPSGGMWDAVFDASMNYVYGKDRGEVA